MKTISLKFILLALGTVFLTSCTTLLYTSLDVLRPAEVAFAPEASDLLIINNTVNQPADYGHKTELLNQKVQNLTISTDSLSIFCLGALFEDLEGKDFFSTVKLIPKSVNKSKDFYNSNKLDKTTVKNLCFANHTNAILSLDKIKVIDDLSEYYLPESSSFLGTLELRIESSWNIHYLNKTEVTSIQFNDTVNWESESYYRKRVLTNLPKREDALIDGALTVGHECVNRFVPYWDKVDRYLFKTSNKLMKQGMDSFYVKKWKCAINSWDIVLNKEKNIQIRAQVANNIAIAYEIFGDIDKSLEYAKKSFFLFNEVSFSDTNSIIRLSNYIEELNQRKKEILILKKQLND